MHLKIRQYGDPILKQVGRKVIHFDDWLKGFAQDMVETLKFAHAAGLAAQHVGYALQVCVIDILESAKNLGERLSVKVDEKPVPVNLLMPLVVVNPEVIPMASKLVSYVEGSVSFPGIEVPISRPEMIHLRYQDVGGNWHTLECGGILARCLFHEIDQMHGILFIDKAERKDLVPFEGKLKKLKRSSLEFLKKGQEG
ncbi:MAG: peptide deformylase [Verrucomicrobia bacterium]|nr:MAG: peptide deformylase [Verrucomicrobiota bacterium]